MFLQLRANKFTVRNRESSPDVLPWYAVRTKRNGCLEIRSAMTNNSTCPSDSRKTKPVYFFIKSKSASTVASTPVLMEGSGEILKKGEWWDGTLGPPAASASMSAFGVPPTEK